MAYKLTTNHSEHPLDCLMGIIIELGTVGRKGMKYTTVVLEVVKGSAIKKCGTRISILKIAWFSVIQQRPKLCQESERIQTLLNWTFSEKVNFNKQKH